MNQSVHALLGHAFEEEVMNKVSQQFLSDGINFPAVKSTPSYYDRAMVAAEGGTNNKILNFQEQSAYIARMVYTKLKTVINKETEKAALSSINLLDPLVLKRKQVTGEKATTKTTKKTITYNTASDPRGDILVLLNFENGRSYKVFFELKYQYADNRLKYYSPTFQNLFGINDEVVFYQYAKKLWHYYKSPYEKGRGDSFWRQTMYRRFLDAFAAEKGAKGVETFFWYKNKIGHKNDNKVLYATLIPQKDGVVAHMTLNLNQEINSSAPRTVSTKIYASVNNPVSLSVWKQEIRLNFYIYNNKTTQEIMNGKSSDVSLNIERI